MDRPTPKTVLGRCRIMVQTARKSIMETLLSFIKKNVDKHCYEDVPLSMLANTNENYGAWDDILARKVGRPITSMRGFTPALENDAEPRRTVIGGLMGCLTEKAMKDTQAISCAAKADEVYYEARRTMDGKWIQQWIDGGGKGIKRFMADNIQEARVKTHRNDL